MTDAIPDTRFERLIADLVEGTDQHPAAAKLMALGEHSAVLWLGDHHALLFRYVPGTEDRLGDYLRKVTHQLRRGRLDLVLVGGQDESLRAILSQAQVGWGIRRQIGVMHLPDDGPCWFGRRTETQGGLARSLQSVTKPEQAALADLRTRLAALVDPNADGSLDVAVFAKRLQGIRPWVTLVLLAACIFLFLLELVWGSPTYAATLGRLGANVPELVFAGQWQRLASSIFLHAGLPHLVMNSIGLYVLGSFLERLLGPWRLLILFGLSGLAGSLASACLSGVMSVGASGAIMGLFGAAAVLAYFPGRVAIPAPVLEMLKRNTGMILLLNVMISFLPRIDLWAHVGGGVCGALLLFGSRILMKNPPVALASDGRPHRPIWLVSLGVLIALVLVLGNGLAVVEGKPWELVQSPDWERSEILPGVSIDLPKPIRHRKPNAVEGELNAFVIGNSLLNPLWMLVRFIPDQTDVSNPKEIQKVFEKYKAEMIRPPAPAAKRLGEPQRVVVDSIPMMRDEFRDTHGLRLFRFRHLLPGWSVATIVFVPERSPKLWMELVDRIPAGIRMEGDVGSVGEAGR